MANPANTNALILKKFATTLHESCITSLTMLDQNRAVGQLSQKLKVANNVLERVVIWGNHSATQVPDYEFALAEGQPVTVAEEGYLEAFEKRVAKRGT